MRFSTLLLLVCAFPFSFNAQEDLPDEIDALYSKYGGFDFAVMMMDRDEWEMYRLSLIHI